MDTTLSPPTGQLLDGRYRVESQLARGGMATVYRGRDIRLDRPVALKVAHADLARDAEFVRRFITEARAVAQLSDPNVVAVFDQGSAGDVHWIAMEYVPGPTLREVLQARGSLSVGESLDIIAGVLAGLSAAHQAGIIHRDVKPENVLLGRNGVVKIADFGLARAAAAVSQTKTGMIIGTAAYLAPEQVSASASDARTDVYAAGVMLFEMLTGVQPHVGESPLAVAYKHVTDTVPPPSSRVPGLPPALDALVGPATSRDPGQRPANAGQFLDAVNAVRGSASLAGGRHGQQTVPPGGAALGAAALGGAALAAAAHGASQGTARLPETDLSPARPGGTAPGGAPPGGRAGGRHGRPADGPGPLAAPGEHDDIFRPANPTLVVSDNSIVPGLGEDDDYGRRWRASAPPGGPGAGGRGPGAEPPLQRLLFSRRLFYILGGLALVLVTVLLIWWLTAGKSTTVPQVSGWSAGLAKTELTGLGFKVSEGTPQHSNIPSGHVIMTTPKAGAKSGDGSTITLILSLGPVKVKVPSVTGQQLAQAEQVLRAAGLTLAAPREVTSATVPSGVVISTTPVAGTRWPKNKPVEITVSDGPPLPNFKGQQVATAQAAAAAGGYSINPVQAPKSNQPSGTIVRQSPPAGSPIKSGEVVTVYVSAGPPQAAVPDVRGMDVHEAEKTLREAGFQVQVNKVGPGKRVFSYGPTGSAPQGTTITINVGFSFF
ncbi:MAG TPA: PASTA domain-containing protein [Streptosporangiaceae bacterium]|nr:PASTA domain-containing protein [Streptosporangiaceae bacterium]